MIAEISRPKKKQKRKKKYLHTLKKMETKQLNRSLYTAQILIVSVWKKENTIENKLIIWQIYMNETKKNRTD